MTAEIVISADTMIDGSRQDVTINGNHAVRVFIVNSGVALSLNELSITQGYFEGRGGGIRPKGLHCDIGAVEQEHYPSLPSRMWVPVVYGG